MSQVAPKSYQGVEAYIRDESLGAPRSLVLWGKTHFLISLLFFFLAPVINVPDLTKYYYLSIILFLGVAHQTCRIPFRLPLPILILVLLQLWYCVTSLYAEVALGRDYSFGMTFYHPLGCVLAFMNAACVSYIDPSARRYMVNGLGFVAGLSAIVAVGQFVGVGPLIALGNFVVKFEDVTNFLKDVDTVRAPGILSLATGPIYLLLMMVTSLSALAHHPLSKRIALFGGLCFLGAVLPQLRNILPAVGISCLIVAVLAVRRYKLQALWVVAAIAVVGAMVVYFFPQKFAYYLDFFSGEQKAGTLQWRTNNLWPQAMAVYRDSPWFGIGIEPRFAGYPGTSDGYVGYGIMDGQYYFALACGGIPALALVIAFAVSCMVWPIQLLRQGISDPLRKQLVIGLCATITTMPVIFAFGNLFTNNIIVLPLFSMMGAALASRAEHQAQASRTLFQRYGKVRLPENA